MPSIVSAATIALIIASSTAWTVASNKGDIRSLGKIFALENSFLVNESELAVENAIKYLLSHLFHNPQYTSAEGKSMYNSLQLKRRRRASLATTTIMDPSPSSRYD